jgi:Bacteriophage Lambda NinG protein
MLILAEMLTLKHRRCKWCKSFFAPERNGMIVCSPECGLEYGRKLKQKTISREVKEKKKKLKENDRRFLLKRAQAEFNSYIRTRDVNQPCISCGALNKTWDSGHFRSVGATPHLRFDENNVHKQCVKCNKWNSGNHVAYRLNLIVRIGLQAVEELENDNHPKHYTNEDLIEIYKTYKQKLKELRNENHGG